MLEIIKYISLIITGLMFIYIIFRVASSAVFRSYFEIKRKEVEDGDLEERTKKIDEEETEGKG